MYGEVVSDKDIQPRVVVVCTLMKYYWYKGYDKKTGKPIAAKDGTRPMPPYKQAGSAAEAAPTQLAGDISCKVRITAVSDKPAEDPNKLDYDEALMHVSAVAVDGPLAGKEIGLRYWILHKGDWTKADKQVKAGDVLDLTLTPWQQAIKKEGTLSQHLTFDTIMQDFLVPVFWISKGKLAPDQVL